MPAPTDLSGIKRRIHQRQTQHADNLGQAWMSRREPLHPGIRASPEFSCFGVSPQRKTVTGFSGVTRVDQIVIPPVTVPVSSLTPGPIDDDNEIFFR
jgi:hypothetical protein